MAAFINSLSSGKKTPAGVSSIQIEAGYGALVDPVNACPYIFVLPDLVHEFPFEPGSGTDHLRQRIKSKIAFEELVSKHRAELADKEVYSSSLPNLTIRSLALVRDALFDSAEVVFTGRSLLPEVNDATGRIAFIYSGTLVYPAWLGKEPRWGVQSVENKGSDRVFGNTLHCDEDGAKKWIDSSAIRDQILKSQKTNISDSFAKFDAFANSELNMTVSYPAAFNIETGTVRSCLWRASEMGFTATERVVRDSASKMVDVMTIDAATLKGLRAHLSDPATPGMQQINQAWDRICNDVYERPEFRLHCGPNDSFESVVISKIEFDFFSALRSAAARLGHESDSPALDPHAIEQGMHASQFNDSPSAGGAIVETLTVALSSRVAKVYASQMSRSQSVLRH